MGWRVAAGLGLAVLGVPAIALAYAAFFDPEQLRYEEGLVAMQVRVGLDQYRRAHQGRFPAPERFAADLGPYLHLSMRQPYVWSWEPADVVIVPWAERDQPLGRGHAYDGKAFDRRTYGAIVYACSPDRTAYRMFGVAEQDGQAVPEGGPP